MDVTISDEQQAITDLAGRILGESLPPERLREIEAEPDWFARDVWAELAKADLLGLCLPEQYGGGGYGMFEAALLLEQVGRARRPGPAPRHAGARRDARGRVRHPMRNATRCCPRSSPATQCSPPRSSEPGDALPPDVPTTSATREGDRWRIDGEKVLVPAAHLARTHPRPGRAPATAQSAVFLVDPTADGVTLDRRVAVNLEPLSTLHLDGVVVDRRRVLGGDGDGRKIVALDHRPGAGRALRHPGRRVRGGPADHRQVHVRTRAVRHEDRHVPGRRPPCGRRLHRHRGHPAHRLAGRLAARRGPARPTRRWPSPSSGRPRARSGWCTPPSTCTAASASTSTTRSTGTSAGPSRWSSPSAAGPRIFAVSAISSPSALTGARDGRCVGDALYGRSRYAMISSAT